MRDHDPANTELTVIADEARIEMPKTLDNDHQKIHDQLQSMHAKAFDQQYMRIMVEDHGHAVKLFRQEISSAHDLRLKQFAQKVLPTIGEHQKVALDLSARLSHGSIASVKIVSCDGLRQKADRRIRTKS